MTMTQAVAVVAFALAGCGGDYCSRNSMCPNDPQQTQAQRDQCRAQLQANQNSPCYGEGLAYVNCYADNQVCGGNGTSDVGLWATKASNNCRNQAANVSSCCIKNPHTSLCP